jgi:hypothetical protein
MPCERLCKAGEAHHRGRQVETVQEGVKRVDPHREHRRQGRPDQASAEDSGGRERGLKVRPQAHRVAIEREEEGCMQQ